jgi:LysR family transcriptional regulator for metE and metH
MVLFTGAKILYALDMRDITLRQLRFLAEVVRAGSLAGGAERLHLTGPAVAQQLRLLERTIGLPLLDRTPRGQEPTEAGRTLVETGKRIEVELALCAESLRSLRSATSGHITLGAVSTAKYFAPQVLAAFQRTRPEVEVSLYIGNRDEIVTRLADFQVDLAVMGRPPQGLEVEQEVFGEHPYVIIAAPDHPLAGRRRITLRSLAGHTLLVRERGSGTRSHLEALFTSAGVEPARSMELTSNESIKQAVMAGLGLALISAHTVAPEVKEHRLALLDVRGVPVRRHWLLVRMRHKAPSPVCRALWDFFLAEAAAQLPRLELPEVGAS